MWIIYFITIHLHKHVGSGLDPGLCGLLLCQTLFKLSSLYGLLAWIVGFTIRFGIFFPQLLCGSYERKETILSSEIRK